MIFGLLIAVPSALATNKTIPGILVWLCYPTPFVGWERIETPQRLNRRADTPRLAYSQLGRPDGPALENCSTISASFVCVFYLASSEKWKPSISK